MVKVAIVQLSSKHTEIFGTFIQIFQHMGILFDIFYDEPEDKYTFLPYYKKVFNSNYNLFNTKLLMQMKENYNQFVFTSSIDDVHEYFKKNTNLCTYVTHQAIHLKDYMKKNLIVSPLIEHHILNKSHTQYILPIYNVKYNKPFGDNSSNIFAIIGAIRKGKRGTIDKDIEQLIDILQEHENKKFKIYIFMRKGDWNTIKRKYKMLEYDEHIVPFPGLTTQQMINKLKSVKCILSLAKHNGWFHTKRLTGALPLAINLELPIVVDEKLKEIYNLKGFLSYEKNLSTVFKELLELSNDNYSKIKQNMNYFKEEVMNTNRNRLVKLLIDNCRNEKKYDLKIETVKKDPNIHDVNLLTTISKE